ncbi:MAG TPA: GNAT family N-acetyltransferase [Sphingobacteriaceae bacterium]
MIVDSIPVSGEVNILVGDEVAGLLSDDTFLRSWDELYRSCRWATPFQSKEFVTTWYRVYEEKYVPILITKRVNGALKGILPLAKANSRPVIYGAGELNAEYHAWLSSEDDKNAFIKAALIAVQNDFPDCIIELRYIPSTTPVAWLKSDKDWKFKSVIRKIDQPLIALNEAHFEEKLNTKAKRKIIRRLQEQGELKFERVSDITTFAYFLDEIITQSDFRKAAMYNKTPFRDDPQKKQLTLALFEKGLLELTVLTLNNQLIASKIITVDKDWGYLKGGLSQAPQFARLSPGLLHFLMLGKFLAGEGKTVFDLTPGGDPYKDQLATDHAWVYHVWIVPQKRTYLKLAAAEFVKKILRKVLTAKGINVKRFKTRVIKAKELIRRKGVFNGIRGIIAGKRAERNLSTYMIQPEETPAFSSLISRDNLNHLLQFLPDGSSVSRWEFLADAMKRLETGGHVYSTVANGRLQACAWQGKSPSPDDGVLTLEGLYCYPSFRDDFAAFLGAVAQEISGGSSSTGVLTVVEADDTALNRILSHAA